MTGLTPQQCIPTLIVVAGTALAVLSAIMGWAP
jgi:hypothetical protein